VDWRLLVIMGLKVMTKGVRSGWSGFHVRLKSWRREFKILGAAMLKLRVPNEVWRNGVKRLMFESLRERVEDTHAKNTSCRGLPKVIINVC